MVQEEWVLPRSRGVRSSRKSGRRGNGHPTTSALPRCTSYVGGVLCKTTSATSCPLADRLPDEVTGEWRPEFVPPPDSQAREQVAGWLVMGNGVLHHDDRHAVTGLAVVAAWVLLFCAAQAHYVPLETAYQAHLDTLNNPPILQDPPAQIALAEFFVGTVFVLAVPAAAIALLTGLSTARNSRGVTWVRVLGWATFGIGAVGALPALLAGFFGAIGAFLNALTLLG
jgi:hypothetical protein